jgi:predicted nucleic acid-binding protein
MIVIDTNILAYGILEQSDEGLRRQAHSVLDSARRILVPTLWRHEFLNILAGYAKTSALSLDDASRAWYQTVALAQDAEAEVDMIRALELSKQLGISAYDAQFIALAEAANTVLVTEDRRLRSAAGGRAVSMEDYLAA